MKTYQNQFTREYWRGHEDRAQAPDYVCRQLHTFRLYGRINGEVTTNQEKLAALRAELLSAFAL